jgi:hypothetical protein
MTYICQKEKVKIPWKNIAKKMSEQVPHTTPGAISQHLSKVRLSRRGGSLEPPSPIRKSKKASATTGGGISSTERSETMTPKQVNKKTNKRAREATPDAPQKRKHVKKAFVDTKPASKGTPRRAGNTNDSNEDTGLVKSFDHSGNNLSEMGPVF